MNTPTDSLRNLLLIAADAAGKLNATNKTCLFSSLEIEQFAKHQTEYFVAISNLSQQSNADHIANTGEMVEKAICLTLDRAINSIPGGSVCDPQQISDAIRSISVQEIMEGLE